MRCICQITWFTITFAATNCVRCHSSVCNKHYIRIHVTARTIEYITVVYVFFYIYYDITHVTRKV